MTWPDTLAVKDDTGPAASLPALKNDQRIGDPHHVAADDGFRLAEDLVEQRLIRLACSDELPAIALQQETGDSALIVLETAVPGHQAATWLERGVGQSQQVQGLAVIEMVNDAVGHHEIVGGRRHRHILADDADGELTP